MAANDSGVDNDDLIDGDYDLLTVAEASSRLEREVQGCRAELEGATDHHDRTRHEARLAALQGALGRVRRNATGRKDAVGAEEIPSISPQRHA
ncbi:hypothetical protein [Mycolicibacterium elephantis]